MAVAIEQVVGIERDDLSGRRHEMDARALDAADTKIEAIEKLHDRDPKDVLVGQPGRRFDLRQAA